MITRSTLLTGGAALVVTVLAGIFIGRAVSDSGDSATEAVGARPSLVADEAARHLLAPEFVGTTDAADGGFDLDALAETGGRLEAGDVAAEPDRTVPLLAPVRLDDPDLTDPTLLTPPPSDAATAPVDSFVAAGVVGVSPAPGADEPQPGSGATVDIIETAGGTSDSTTETASDEADASEPATDAAEPDADAAADDAVEAGPIDVAPISDDAPEPADDTSDEPITAAPTVVLPDFGILLEIPPIVFDPCAGPVPGGPICGGGFAGTIFALSAPPPLDVSVTAGIATTPRVSGGVACPRDTPEPADDQLAFTIWSTTPLASADVDLRPVGSTRSPVELTVSTAESVRAEWERRFDAADEYDASWGLVPTCVVADVDTSGAQEVSGIASDTFERLGTIPTTPISTDTTTDRRPPTETRIEGISPVAHVRAWTTAEGSVVFRPRQLGNAIGTDDDLDCATAGTVPDSRVYPSNRPNPDIYDPDFSRSFFAKIPFQTGGRLLVCVEIYDTENPLIPLVVERHLFEAPMQPRPEVYLASIDTRGDGDAIDELFWRAGEGAGGAASPGCDRWFSTPAIDDDVLAVVNEPLWECTGSQTSLTATGTFDLALQAVRNGSTIIDVVVPIDAQDCRVERCPQRSDYFRVPIVARGELTCWRGVNLVCPGEQDIDAVALIGVRYPLRAGRGGLDGRVTPLDDVDIDVLASEPRVTVPTMTVQRTDTFARWDATFRFQTDRPVTAAIEPFELPSGTRCFESSRSDLTAAPATDFSIDVDGLCANRGYGVSIHLVDEDGTEWRFDPGSGYVTPGAPAANFRVQVDFVGPAGGELFIEPGDRARLGNGNGLASAEVRLPTSASIAETCFSTSDAYTEIERILLASDATELTLRATLPVRRVAATGPERCRSTELLWEHYERCNDLPRPSEEYDRVCVDPPGSAPPPPSIGPETWTFHGRVAVELLEAGVPVVVTTAANDAGVALRFTIERTSNWMD